MNKVGVCDATAGPGATNLIGGIAESYHALIPVIALTADTYSKYNLKGASQDCNHLDLFKPVVKGTFYIEHIERIPELIKSALLLATTGRPGLFHVNIPEYVFYGEAEFKEEDLFSILMTLSLKKGHWLPLIVLNRQQTCCCRPKIRSFSQGCP